MMFLTLRRLGALDKYMAERGAFLPHGECSKVCVGGHAQSGGFSVDCPRSFGFFVDYVQEFDMLLAPSPAGDKYVTVSIFVLTRFSFILLYRCEPMLLTLRILTLAHCGIPFGPSLYQALGGDPETRRITVKRPAKDITSTENDDLFFAVVGARGALLYMGGDYRWNMFPNQAEVGADGSPVGDQSLDALKDHYFDSIADYQRVLGTKKVVDPNHVFTPNDFCVGANLKEKD